jgi:hypothetical protein
MHRSASFRTQSHLLTGGLQVALLKDSSRLAALLSRLIHHLLLFKFQQTLGARMPGGKCGCCLCAFRRESGSSA